MKTILNIFLLLTAFLSVYSCKEEITVDTSRGVLITSFSVKSLEHETIYPLDVAVDGTITNMEEIPWEIDFSQLVATFEVNTSSAKIKVGDIVQESGITVNDFSSPLIYHVYDESGNTRNFTVDLKKAIRLLRISFSDESLKDNTLTIHENGTITNEVFFSKDVDLTSLTFEYESSYSDYLLYTEDGTVVESGKTKINCSEPVNLKLKSPDGGFKDYTINFQRYDQILTVEPETYSHIYEGGGISFALHLDYIWTMSPLNQKLFFELMFRDVKLKYLQYYTEGRPSLKRERYDSVCKFISEAKKYNSNINLVFVLGTLPADLCYNKEVDGEIVSALDVTRKDIYDKVAEYMLELMNDMYENYGYEISCFSMANEPDLGKKWRWGYEKPIKGIGIMLDKVLPIFDKLLKSEANKYKLSSPKIIAPSTINVNGCYEFICDWKKKYTNAWKYIDIVSTHQYSPRYGCNIPAFNKVSDLLGGKGFYQTEMHTNRGDNLGDDFLADNTALRGVLSLATLFSSSVLGGIQSWFYFLTHNYKNIDGSSAALIQVKNEGEPIPFKQYYAFKQLHNLLSSDTYVVKHINDNEGLKMICMNVKDENKVVAHIGNILESSCPVNINVDKKIKRIKIWKTDENSDMKLVCNYEPEIQREDISVLLDKYSLTSIEMYY